MNKKYFPLVILLLIGALVASAFGWVAMTRSNESASLSGAVNTWAARRDAKERFNEAQGSQTVNITLPTASETMADRWNAMASFYKAQGSQTVNFTSPTAAETMADRWNAMATFYKAQHVSNDAPRSRYYTGQPISDTAISGPLGQGQ